MSTAAAQYPPTREFDLLTWSANFRQRIQADPGSVGLTALQASRYGDLHDAWAQAYRAANEPGTNSKAAIGAKNNAKENLLTGGSSGGGARELVAIVQAYPGTTDSMRAQLGLKVKRAGGGGGVVVPAPRVAPALSVLHVIGRRVKCRLRALETPDRRGKPDGVLGATILMYVGDQPPQHMMQWTFALNTSRPVFDVHFPSSVPAGAKVWLTAIWFNGRMETSPASLAQSTRLADGLALAA